MPPSARNRRPRPSSGGRTDFQLQGGAELAEISRKLRKVGDGKTIKKRMAKDIRAAAKPLVPAVRQSIMAIPTTGSKHTGLRQRMAKATKLTIRTSGRSAGATIRVDGRKMPPGEGALPAYMEGSKPRWRHPVYGNEDKYVQQKPHPYFYKVVNRSGKKSRKAIKNTLDDITKQIT